ncbi:hypothetical protein AYI68_g4196 [Smittium mucronatum]|uniref:HTH APSES-type domain-containing protein n=1 Tax=Smittium mucronatum TaxID=133383 RepID=A0A1R0GXT1_9FUNG|nr:hypothetical protein AYI68_g4196 [Smittium mucronatum]
MAINEKPDFFQIPQNNSDKPDVATTSIFSNNIKEFPKKSSLPHCKTTKTTPSVSIFNSTVKSAKNYDQQNLENLKLKHTKSDITNKRKSSSISDYFFDYKILYPDDSRDKVFTAILRALVLVKNKPCSPKELSNIIIQNNLTVLGGATPYATVSSRISQHFKRVSGSNFPRESILGRVSNAENPRKILYYLLPQSKKNSFFAPSSENLKDLSSHMAKNDGSISDSKNFSRISDEPTDSFSMRLMNNPGNKVLPIYNNRSKFLAKHQTTPPKSPFSESLLGLKPPNIKKGSSLSSSGVKKNYSNHSTLAPGILKLKIKIKPSSDELKKNINSLKLPSADSTNLSLSDFKNNQPEECFVEKQSFAESPGYKFASPTRNQNICKNGLPLHSQSKSSLNFSEDVVKFDSYSSPKGDSVNRSHSLPIEDVGLYDEISAEVFSDDVDNHYLPSLNPKDLISFTNQPLKHNFDIRSKWNLKNFNTQNPLYSIKITNSHSPSSYEICKPKPGRGKWLPKPSLDLKTRESEEESFDFSNGVVSGKIGQINNLSLKSNSQSEIIDSYSTEEADNTKFKSSYCFGNRTSNLNEEKLPDNSSKDSTYRFVDNSTDHVNVSGESMQISNINDDENNFVKFHSKSNSCKNGHVPSAIQEHLLNLPAQKSSLENPQNNSLDGLLHPDSDKLKHADSPITHPLPNSRDVCSSKKVEIPPGSPDSEHNPQNPTVDDGRSRNSGILLPELNSNQSSVSYNDLGFLNSFRSILHDELREPGLISLSELDLLWNDSDKEIKEIQSINTLKDETSKSHTQNPSLSCSINMSPKKNDSENIHSFSLGNDNATSFVKENSSTLISAELNCHDFKKNNDNEPSNSTCDSCNNNKVKGHFSKIPIDSDCSKFKKNNSYPSVEPKHRCDTDIHSKMQNKINQDTKDLAFTRRSSVESNFQDFESTSANTKLSDSENSEHQESNFTSPKSVINPSKDNKGLVCEFNWNNDVSIPISSSVVPTTFNISPPTVLTIIETVPVYMTCISRGFVFRKSINAASHKPDESDSKSDSGHSSSQSNLCSKTFKLLRLVENGYVNASSLLEAGGVSSEQERNIVLSLEVGRFKWRRPESQLSGTWVPLSRARALAATCSLTNRVGVFLNDNLESYFPSPLPSSFIRHIIMPYLVPEFLSSSFPQKLETSPVNMIFPKISNISNTNQFESSGTNERIQLKYSTDSLNDLNDKFIFNSNMQFYNPINCLPTQSSEAIGNESHIDYSSQNDYYSTSTNSKVNLIPFSEETDLHLRGNIDLNINDPKKELNSIRSPSINNFKDGSAEPKKSSKIAPISNSDSNLDHLQQILLKINQNINTLINKKKLKESSVDPQKKNSKINSESIPSIGLFEKILHIFFKGSRMAQKKRNVF